MILQSTVLDNKLNFTITEYDQENSIVENGTWTIASDQLTINTPDTSLVLTIEDINKTNASLSISFNLTSE